ELLMARVVELDPVPAAERRRVGADVHRDVEDAPADDPDELGLPRRGLIVQAAQGAPARARVVVLHEDVGDADLAVALGAVGLEEEAAIVPEGAGGDEHEAGEGERLDLHHPPSATSSARAWR